MNQNPVLAGIAAALDRHSRGIDINPGQIQILNSPQEFYETLKVKITGAKKRIYLSTLYIGNSEDELISFIRQALERNQDLKVSILTDALRGTRETPDPSCASLLSPLVADFPRRVEIRMYHTPNLTGIRKMIAPKRINEGWGLQHMKLYGFDDEIILSGANLSREYFSNRQDRYHVISSKRVSDYYAQVHHTLCSASFLLHADQPRWTYNLRWPASNAAPPPSHDPQGYNEAVARIFKLITAIESPGSTDLSKSNTILYPLLVIPYTYNNELPAIQSLLSFRLPTGSSFFFTAGYFNPHSAITISLLACASRRSKMSDVSDTVLTASPWANGFYGSKGISGMLPAAYTLLSRRFLKSASGNIVLREWRRGTFGTPDGWTYHAKGLWLILGSNNSQSSIGVSSVTNFGPSVTLIGSSNYTTRSYSLDSEVGAIILTCDMNLQKDLQKEQEGLLRYSKPLSDADFQVGERRVGIWVKLAMWIVKLVGSSL